MVTPNRSVAVESDQSSPARRRAEIERVAARLFAERGYDATTVEQIAAAVGLSKPMIYRAFESKRELFISILERRRDELAAAPLEQFLPRGGAPAGQLARMIEAWLAHLELHPDSTRLLLRDTHGDLEIQARQQELRARQRSADIALLREFAPDVPPAELEPLGEIIRSSLAGLGLWWLENPEVPRTVARDAMARVLRGILLTLG